MKNVLYNYFQVSLYRKVILAFIIVGLLPLIMVYLYLILYGKDKITQNIIAREFDNLQTVIVSTQNNLKRADKELLFLSKLDAVDDVVVGDIDERLARLLQQKKRDMNANLEFIVLDSSLRYVTSSAQKNLQGVYTYKKELQNAILHKKNIFIHKRKLVFYTKMYASFDPKKFLGYMLLEYGLKNLSHFAVQGKDIYGYFINPQTNMIIGKNKKIMIPAYKQKGAIITKNSVMVYKKLTSPFLENWYYVNVIKKEKALDFLYDFLFFMAYMLPVAVLLVVLVGFISANRIIQPLKKLTQSVLRIRQNRDYKQHININAHDEIGKLTDAFNELLTTTDTALETLEAENRQRLKRFIELITIFNAIIQTESETQCIELSIAKIQNLTDDARIYFEQKKANGAQIYVTNFEKNTKECYGTIVFDKEDLNENELRFYNSIATMIALQLERIRLINATMQASRAKSAFISNMSHELRTPLNAIIGFTQYLITYESLQQEQMEIIGNIENSASYLLEMINGILDIAKIEAGKMELHYEMVDIKELLLNVVNMLTPLAEQKELTFSLDMQECKEESIFTDPYFVKQIIINLLSNAIKFTEKGGVDIRLETLSTKQLQLNISDTGIGIEAEDLKKLFQDFAQLDHKIQKKYKGTGLGLSLSKKLAKLLKGDLLIKSEGIEKGSRAILILPI